MINISEMAEKVSGRINVREVMRRSRMVREAFHQDNMAPMAKELGVSHDTWANAEKKGIFSKTNAIKLMRLKGISPLWIWGLEDTLPAALVGRISGLPKPIAARPRKEGAEPRHAPGKQLPAKPPIRGVPSRNSES